MTVDWSKPIEYISIHPSIAPRPARLICADRKGFNPFIVLYTTSAGEDTIAVKPDGSQYGYSHQYIRNVPPPKKKMWEVTLRKVSTLKKTYEFDPLVRHGGKLCGFTGWTVEDVKEIEV